MTYRATKTYGHDLGLSCCFRQWRAKSHCRTMHGYALSVGFVFEADQLDDNGWVVDFGSLKPVKAMLVDLLDHRTLVAADDPQQDWFTEAARRGVAEVIVVDRVGCEAFAELIGKWVADWLVEQDLSPRVRLVSTEVREHGANSAVFLGPPGAYPA